MYFLAVFSGCSYCSGDEIKDGSTEASLPDSETDNQHVINGDEGGGGGGEMSQVKGGNNSVKKMEEGLLKDKNKEEEVQQIPEDQPVASARKLLLEDETGERIAPQQTTDKKGPEALKDSINLKESSSVKQVKYCIYKAMQKFWLTF